MFIDHCVSSFSCRTVSLHIFLFSFFVEVYILDHISLWSYVVNTFSQSDLLTLIPRSFYIIFYI